LFAILFNRVEVKSGGFNSITIHSVGLNKLRFNPQNWTIIIDSPDTSPQSPCAECAGGLYNKPPPSKSPQILVSKDNTDLHIQTIEYVETMGFRHKIATSTYNNNRFVGNNYLPARALSKLIAHQNIVDGIKEEYEGTLKLNYYEIASDDPAMVTAYYTIDRMGDILLDIQPVDRNSKCTYSLHVFGRKREIPENGLHHPFPIVCNKYANMCYAVTGGLTQDLHVRYTVLFLGPRARSELIDSVQFNYDEEPDLISYFAK